MTDETNLHHRIDVMEAKNEKLEVSLVATLEGFRADMEKRFGEMNANIEAFRGDIARSQVTIIISIAVMLGVSLSIYAFLSGGGQAPAP